MRKLIVGVLLGAVVVSGYAAEVIPQPLRVDEKPGRFELKKRSVIYCDGALNDTAVQLRGYLAPATGYKFKIKSGDGSSGIVLKSSGDRARFGDEGYSLSVTPKRVTIEAATSAGIFYGIQTLRQLLPVEIYSAEKVAGVEWSIACVEIFDTPRFKWRGMMLDVSRHFFGPDYIKKYLDNLALHKINVFHWHLTDDQGWRVEIKKYPKLTEIGAWRGDGTSLPKSKHDKDSARYGGFYTQEELKDIVAYAAKLHINIMPEIDVPGHARAITTAYPETLPTELTDSESVQGIKANVISPAREENYKMMEDIFGELAEIFPFEYIHVGGDEVNRGLWKKCPEVKKVMEREGYKNVGQMQGYFTRRLEKIVGKNGKKLVGWNEIMGGGVSKDTIIMSWIGEGPGINAAKRGHKVVMTPGPYTYFDMKYPGPGETGHWWAGIVSTKKTYSYNPLAAKGLTPEEQGRFMGSQACLWTEFVPDNADADYKTYPRLCALSEVVWSQQDKRSWDDFSERLGTHLKRLGVLGVNYHLAIPEAFFKTGKVTIVPPNGGAAVYYTLDSSEPTEESACWNGEPIAVSNPSVIRMRTFFDGRKSKIIKGAKRLSFAGWNKPNAGGEYKTFEFDVSAEISSAGSWKLEFMPKGGKNKLMVRNVLLYADGEEVAADKHEASIQRGKRESLYTLNVADFNKDSKYIIKVDMKGDGGNNTKGVMLLDRSDSLEPAAKITTTLPGYGSNSPENMIDWYRGSIFWTSRAPKKGDRIEIVFDEKVK